MPLFRGGGTENLKHKDSQKTVWVVLNKTAAIPPQPPSASRNYLSENSASRFQIIIFPQSKKKEKKATQERPEFGVTGQRQWEQAPGKAKKAMGTAVSHTVLLKKPARKLSKIEHVDSHPRSVAPRAAGTSFLRLPIFASTNHLRPAPLVVRPAPSLTSQSRHQPKNRSVGSLPTSQAPGKYSLARQIFMRTARIHELGQILPHGCRHLSSSSAEAVWPLTPPPPKENECSPPECS